jgi:putative ABC transport system permease protein
MMVLADGVVLGAAGGVLGIGLGVLGAVFALPELVRLTHHEPGAFRVRPAELALAAALGVVTGLIAAMVPAVVTGRQEVLASLTGGRKGARGVPWRSALLGLVTVVAGLAATVYGAYEPGIHTVPLAGGVAVCELGVVCCTPLLVTAAGRLGRLLPLAGRMALRDSARNRARTAPAVAAILAAVAGSTAVAVVLTTNDARGRAQYTSFLRPGQVALRFGDGAGGAQAGQGFAVADGSVSAVSPGSSEGGAGTAASKPVDPAKAIAAIGAALPLRSAAVVQGEDFTGLVPVRLVLERDAAQACPFAGADSPQIGTSADGQQMVAADPRCAESFGSSEIVPGDAAVLRALTGTVDPAAERVLAAGGVVVFDEHDLTGPASAPTAVVAVDRLCPAASTVVPWPVRAELAKYCGGAAPKPVTLPAALAHTKGGTAVDGIRALVPQSLATSMDVPYKAQMILFDTTRMPTTAEEERANAAVEALGINDLLTVERGYQADNDTAMLALAAIAAFVTLGAAAIATGLAVADGEADLQTLAAVGAPPRVRRVLAGSQATVTATLGAVLGSATGLVPAVALIEARAHSFVDSTVGGSGFLGSGSRVHAQSYLTIPWWFLIGTIVVVPVLAGVGAVAVTRSRIALRRRF